MPEQKNYHRVVWAVDPFHENLKSQLNAVKALRCLHSETNLSIQPVSLLLSGRYDQESKFFLETWLELESVANKNLETLFRGFRMDGLLKPVLLKQDSSSQAKAAHALIKFALDEKADEIVVSSHGRKGTNRILMGSFAESLVLRSPLPSLIVNPKVTKLSRTKNILFPTDFSDKSRIAFEKVLELCRESMTKILLFHKMQYLYPEFGYPFVVPSVSRDSIKEMIGKAEDQALEWAIHAERSGVVVKTHISGKPGYALDDIVRAAKKLGPSGMIAMASQSGPMSSIILGSLTRQVLREVGCPVLVLHPHQDSMVSKTVEELKHTVYSIGNRPVFA